MNKTYEEIFTEILEEAEALHSNGYLGDEEVDVSDDGFSLYDQGGYINVDFDPDNQEYEVEVHNEYFEEDEDELEDETFTGKGFNHLIDVLSELDTGWFMLIDNWDKYRI